MNNEIKFRIIFKLDKYRVQREKRFLWFKYWSCTKILSSITNENEKEVYSFDEAKHTLKHEKLKMHKKYLKKHTPWVVCYKETWNIKDEQWNNEIQS